MNLLLKKRTVVIVQCRLSSTRLPRKAVLNLGGKTVLEWTLCAMKKVPADRYYLAVDEESAAELEPVAKKCGYQFFAGAKEDVLDRFCKVIEISKAKLVVRATADNPFLFYEAAKDLIKAYYTASKEEGHIDYITFKSLPHGSGVEMFDAESLLKAAAMTQDPYDHEHVGPALYNHKDSFKSVFLDPPPKYAHPNLRTTIDTGADYRRARAIVHKLSNASIVKEPYTTEEILSALEDPSIAKPILLVPSVEKGRGTGHLYRCLELASEIGADVYIPQEATLEQTQSLVSSFIEGGELQEYQITRSFPTEEQYSLIVTDLFKTEAKAGMEFSKLAPVLALDEGSSDALWADYLLDIIPSCDLGREANKVSPAFISVPEHRRANDSRPNRIHTALVAVGGEDPSGLSLPSARSLASCGLYVTLICSEESLIESYRDSFPEEIKNRIKVVPPIKNLREKIFEYDLVVTHYGFTAFEASVCGCAVILLSTSSLHEKLAKEYGYNVLSSDTIDELHFKRLLDEPSKLYRSDFINKSEDLGEFVKTIAEGNRMDCPICQKTFEEKDPVVSRIGQRTFRRCRNCGMLYMSWTMQAMPTVYDKAYFYEDYQKQYGKTYEEDMAQIKAQGVRRLSNMEVLYKKGHSLGTPSVLDIGCALGAFLDVANHSGWQVYGLDVSEAAVDYVRKTMHFPAMCATFPAANVLQEFGLDRFDAITMWYVIEHFRDLDSVLKAVSSLLKAGGVFAFSTPSASGVSGRYNTASFFEQSPADHYSLWEPKRTASILKRYGFKVERIVSTGIHPERFPSVKEKNIGDKDFRFKALRAVSRVMMLGDTFEVYCKKVK